MVPFTGALRKSTTKIGAVPILNYRYRHMQVGVADHEGFDWVLKFREGTSDADLKTFCGGDAGEGACSAVGHPTEGGVAMVTVRATEEQLLKMFDRNPPIVEWAEPDTPVELEPEFTEELPSSKNERPYGLDIINVQRASFTGAGTHIYVMDTGIRTTHEDFEGRAVATIDTISGGGRVKECNGDATCATDSHGHGTHVAGTAGGKIYGVAKKATLHAMKVCCGSGSNILAGMDWIASKASKPAVMTMSLGSYSTPESSRVAVDAVVNSGVVVTVSAGNRNFDSCRKSYTFIASAIGVGASDQTNTRASFSNYGPCNAIFAPGVATVSASNRADSGSRTMSGTSMAAPMVAGVASLLLEQDGTRTPEKVRELLRTRSTKEALKSLRDGDPNMLLNAGF